MARPSPAATAGIGALAGILSGMLGIGGGLVVGPALVLAGTPLRLALGTSLCAVAPVAAVAVAAEAASAPEHLLRHWPWAAAVAAGGLLGVQAGRRVLARLPDDVLRAAFLALLLLAAARNLGLLGGLPEGAQPGWAGADGPARAALAGALGVLGGAAAALFGVGGGVVVVPGLFFAVGGVGFHEAAALSLLAMVPTAAAGARAAWRDGRVAPGSLRALLPAALAGAAAGVLARNAWLDTRTLSLAFGAFLAYAAARLALPRRERPS